MVVGITNVTNVSFEQIQQITNVTSLSDFLVRANQIVYDGWFWFIMLFVLWIILLVAANKLRDQLLQNAMYSGAVVSLGAFLLRAITGDINGINYSLITDHQLWVFPLITLFIAIVLWATKE